MSEYEGVLPLRKPPGMTSHDCVAKIRKIMQMRRVGHTGTLDPDVSGVLLLCLGRATRIVEYIQEQPKTYVTEMIIGYTTDTADHTGNMIEQVSHVSLADHEIRQVMKQFIGDIEQIPPMYSALKVNGKRLYELARAGTQVERQPRIVKIFSIHILEMQLTIPYPKIKFEVTCSKGTYIRTLCVDMGLKLGFPAVMSNLIRTHSGSISLDQCMTFAEITERLQKHELNNFIIPIEDALAHLPRGTIPPNTATTALQGQVVSGNELIDFVNFENNELVRLFYWNEEQRMETFVGIFRYEQQTNQFIAVKLFPPI
jgi:tRNA pseudouridine55 synthase